MTLLCDCKVVFECKVHDEVSSVLKTYLGIAENKETFASCLEVAHALANLAAHGDSNSNNAAVGEEARAIAALIQVTRSPKMVLGQELNPFLVGSSTSSNNV
ncbi:hypothetical protein Tco_0382737 [Tanacetum coccineum]